MKNHQLIIYDFKVLFNILDEIKEYLNCELIYFSKKNYKDLISNYSNFTIITKSEVKNLSSVIVVKDFPYKIKKLIELINTNLIKKQFNLQSKQNIGSYKLDYNSKIISKNDIQLSLTEKELKLINFLKNSNHPISIIELQKKVWGYTSTLETHTVETHVYRLRKKLLKKFGDKSFIKSSKSGYIIE